MPSKGVKRWSRQRKAEAKKTTSTNVGSLGRTPELWNKIITLRNQYFKAKREHMLPIHSLSHVYYKSIRNYVCL